MLGTRGRVERGVRYSMPGPSAEDTGFVPVFRICAEVSNLCCPELCDTFVLSRVLVCWSKFVASAPALRAICLC